MCNDQRSLILGRLYLAYQTETFSLPSIIRPVDSRRDEW